MGVINEANGERVARFIQLGLDSLYRRFRIKEGKLILELQPGQEMYALKSAYAQSNTASTEPVKYIKDNLVFPFKDDLHKVERVYTDSNAELYLNDLDNIYSITTPSPNILVVPRSIIVMDAGLPDVLKTLTLTIAYRAGHPKLLDAATTFDPYELDLELPEMYLEPLLYYVASRVHNPLGLTNEFHVGNSYAAKYENSCLRLEQQNLQRDIVGSGNRFNDNGWT